MTISKAASEAEPDAYRTVYSQSKAHKSLYFPYPQSKRIAEAVSQSTASLCSTYFKFQVTEPSVQYNSKTSKP